MKTKTCGVISKCTYQFVFRCRLGRRCRLNCRMFFEIGMDFQTVSTNTSVRKSYAETYKSFYQFFTPICEKRRSATICSKWYFFARHRLVPQPQIRSLGRNESTFFLWISVDWPSFVEHTPYRVLDAT